MTIENGNVVFNCPGEFRIRAASFMFEGPGNTSISLPQLPVSDYQPSDKTATHGNDHDHQPAISAQSRSRDPDRDEPRSDDGCGRQVRMRPRRLSDCV
nr:hypothetical protein [Burkholderia ambifaria]